VKKKKKRLCLLGSYGGKKKSEVWYTLFFSLRVFLLQLYDLNKDDKEQEEDQTSSNRGRDNIVVVLILP